MNGWRDEIGVRPKVARREVETSVEWKGRERCSQTAGLRVCMHQMHKGFLPCNLEYKIRCAAWRPDDTHNLIYALSSCSVGFNCMMLYFATLDDEQL